MKLFSVFFLALAGQAFAACDLGKVNTSLVQECYEQFKSGACISVIDPSNCQLTVRTIHGSRIASANGQNSCYAKQEVTFQACIRGCVDGRDFVSDWVTCGKQ